nr:MAG TPA: hypothetical protein [Crassvirales sp.]
MNLSPIRRLGCGLSNTTTFYLTKVINFTIIHITMITWYCSL